MRRVTPSVLVVCALLIGETVLDAQPKAAPVVVAQARNARVGEPRSFVGTVYPVRVSEVGSAASGRVETFYVKEGQRVKKGDELAKLRTKIIEAQLKAAQASLRVRKAEWDEMKTGPRKEEIAEAMARVENAKSMQQMQEKRLVRARKLLAREGAISQEEHDEIYAQANAANASLREAKASYDLVGSGYREERIRRAEATYDEQAANVALLQEQLERHTMRAPFDGYVMLEHAIEGQWVQQADLIAKVATMQVVDVMTSVPEDYVSSVQLGDAADVHVPAIPNDVIRAVPKEKLAGVGVWRGEQFFFFGKVSAVLPHGDAQARTFPVKVRVRNVEMGESVLLKAAMFTRVQFSVGAKIAATLVPKDALVLGGATPVVYVVTSDGKPALQGEVKPIAVELGVSSGSWIQVKGRIDAGDWVVVRGNERLRPGQEVIGKLGKDDESAP